MVQMQMEMSSFINLAPGFDKGAEAIDETPVRQDFSEGYSANFENLAANGTTKGDTEFNADDNAFVCLLYTSPSPRDLSTSRMPSSA